MYYYSYNLLKRYGLVLFLAGVLSVFIIGCGEEKTIYRVGVLSGLDFFAETVDGLKEEMTKLGYKEGKNITYDLQKTNFDPIEEKRILQKFVSDKVDLIFTFPSEVTLLAKQITSRTNIPVVFAHASTEGFDLVESIRHPGGNITGVRYPTIEITIKRFEILIEAMPLAKQMWIPYQRGYPIVPPQLEILRPAAEAAGVKLIEVPADTAAEIQADLDARAKSSDIGIDAMLMLVEPFSVTPDVFLVFGKFAADHAIPIIGSFPVLGNYGSVFGINVNSRNTGKQAAPIIDKILRGIPAGTIPVVSAESYLWINYPMAQKVGFPVSEGLLRKADQVIR